MVVSKKLIDGVIVSIFVFNGLIGKFDFFVF